MAFATDCVGPAAEGVVAELKPGEVALLENTRFHPEEEKNDLNFSRRLALLGKIYVDDAFGSAHRAHASTEGVAHFLPGVAGFLMEKEIEFLDKAANNPDHPYIVILGGAKISDKIGVITNLLNKCEKLLIGGGMANTFLKAKGLAVGDLLVEESSVETAREIMADAGGKLMLPEDVVIADKFDAAAQFKDGGGRRRSGRLADPRHRARDGQEASPTRSRDRNWWSGTGRWACSNSRPSPRERAIWPRPSPPAARSPSSAAAIPSRPSPKPGWRTRSRTSPPAAEPRWNSSRGRYLPGIAILQDK